MRLAIITAAWRPPRKTGDGVRWGGAKRAGDGGRMRCAFPGAPGAPLPVPLPSSATDVIRYHAFVRVRFRAVRDIKLRRERERECVWKTKESDCKNRRSEWFARSDYICAQVLARALNLEQRELQKEKRKSEMPLFEISHCSQYIQIIGW